MKIVSFNLRCLYDGDGINSFIHRGGFIFDKIQKEKPDIIAFQEVTEANLIILERLLPEYLFVGQFRGENYDGEGLYTAVCKESCQLLGFESIWISPSPYVPGSKFSGQSPWCPRVCVETKIRHKASGQEFRVYNLHLDHMAEELRIAGMKCVFDFVEMFQSRDGLPIVILGDFNAEPEEKTIALCDDYPGIQDVTKHIAASFHDFGKQKIKIDYIYLSDMLKEQVTAVTSWEDVHEGIYLSDHYPICVELNVE